MKSFINVHINPLASAQTPAAAPAPGPNPFAGLPGMGTAMGAPSFPDLSQLMGGASTGTGDMHAQMQSQLMQNPELMQQILNSPMMESLLANPELMTNMMLSNPQLQGMLDANPQIRHILRDPAVRCSLLWSV